MKTICIVDDHRPLWAEIERHLADVNAQCYFVDEDSAKSVIADDAPDLLILGPSSYGKISTEAPPIKTLVIDDSHSSGGIVKPEDRKNVTIAGWPVEPSSLLSLTSELLSVAERRFFKALIRVYPDGDKPGFHMGESEDFSLTGMSFTAAENFPVGRKVEISFFVPKVKKHVRVPAEIMRSFPHQTEQVMVYGCRFVNVDTATNSMIIDFVLGPPR